MLSGRNIPFLKMTWFHPLVNPCLILDTLRIIFLSTLMCFFHPSQYLTMTQNTVQALYILWYVFNFHMKHSVLVCLSMIIRTHDFHTTDTSFWAEVLYFMKQVSLHF